jgi:cytochrome P450
MEEAMANAEQGSRETEVLDIVSIPDVCTDLDKEYYSLLDALREESPVARVFSGGITTLMFLRAEEVRQAVSDATRFSSAPQAGESRGYFDDLLIPASMDPPEHTKFRMLLQPWFTPAVARSLEPQMRQFAKELTESALQKGECDYVEEFAKPYAGLVFCSVVGLPPEDLPDICRWEADVWLPFEQDPQRKRQAAGLTALKDYLGGKIRAAREGADFDSLIGKLVKAEVDGRPLTDYEIKMIGLLACLGGVHTTKATLGKMMHHLSKNESMRHQLVENTDSIGAFIEEYLRLYSLGHSFRHVKVDTELGGCPLKAGERVAVHWVAASRDPREHGNATEFQLDRRPKHLSLGFGPHMCLGMHIARMDMAIALEEWLKVIPDFRVKPGVVVEEQVVSGVGIKSLPLEWKQ